MPALSMRSGTGVAPYTAEQQAADLFLGPAPAGPPPQPEYAATDAGTYSGAGAGQEPVYYPPTVTPEQRMPVGSGEVADATGSYSDPAMRQYPARDSYVAPPTAPPPATSPNGSRAAMSVSPATTFEAAPPTSPSGTSRPWYEGNPLDAVGAAASTAGQFVGLIPQSAAAQLLPGETEEILPPNVRGPGGGGGGVLARGGGRGGSSAPPAAAAPPVSPSTASSVRRPGGRAPIITSQNARARGQRSTPTGTVIRPGTTLPQAPTTNSAALPRRMVSTSARPAETIATAQPRTAQQVVRGAQAPPSQPTPSIPASGLSTASRATTAQAMTPAQRSQMWNRLAQQEAAPRVQARFQQAQGATPTAATAGRNPWGRRVAIGGIGAGAAALGISQASQRQGTSDPRNANVATPQPRPQTPEETALTGSFEDANGTTPGNVTPFPSMRQVSILQADGTVARGEVPPGRSGGASFVGRVNLTAEGAPESVTSVVAPPESVTAAEGRGEFLWSLTQGEFDSLIASGMVDESDRAALQGRPLLIPQTWASTLDPSFAGGAGLANTSAPQNPAPVMEALGLPPTAPGGDFVHDITGGSTWNGSGGGGGSWSGGGGGGSGTSYGGGGDWYGDGVYGGDVAMPPTSPAGREEAPAWMTRESPWANPIFDRHFAVRNSGWPFTNEDGGPAGWRGGSRMRRRRGRTPRTSRSRPPSTNSRTPSGNSNGGNDNLDRALALRDRER